MQEAAPVCGRENDLIAFLYRELSDTEKDSFESHMHSCRVCLMQAGEFRSIRESVMAWRDEWLGHVLVTVPQTSTFINRPKGSSLAALRAFFDLSPLWMKGAVGFAGLLFCVLSVLAIVNLNKPIVSTAEGVNNQTYLPHEMNALVERRVQEELASREALAPQRPPELSLAAGVKDKTARVQSRRLLSSGEAVAANTRIGKARRPLSKAEREELAADLRLVSSGSEGVLNLIDQINQ